MRPRTIALAAALGGCLLALPAGVGAQPYEEAPDLARKVAAGTLPPVDRRLPPAPVVVPVVERIGVYGGTWNEYVSGPAEAYKLHRAALYEHLVRWSPAFDKVLPNLARSWAVDEGGRVFTFQLVEGVRWSDGTPFTAADVAFAVNDVLAHKELSPAGVPAWLRSRGAPAKVEVLGAHTVRFTFAEPQGQFLEHIATQAGHVLTHFPRHYLQQFHKDLNPQGIDALVRAAGLDSWAKLFQQKRWIDQHGDNPDVPVLTPWRLVTPFGGAATQVVLERNPYYWKVDAEGNQLPYIDRVAFAIIQDVEVSALKMMGGDLDSLLLGDDAAAVLTNKALFIENKERGKYRLIDVDFPGPFRVVAVNLTHADPAMRAILGSKDFRIGLSHAINRQEIIDLLYFGQGEPFQAAPAKASRFYDEAFATQYTAYDPKLANAHLDKVLPKRDAQGFRLKPNGERLTMTFEMIARADDTDLFELLVQHWRAVGLDVSFRTMDRSLRDTRLQSNLPDGFTWGGAEGTLGDELRYPRWYVPVSPGAFWARRWVEWFASDGKAGEAPPPEIQRQMDLYRQAITSVDAAVQEKLVREMLAIAKEEFPVIGISTRDGGYAVVGDRLRNVPAKLQVGSGFYRVGVTHPEQYFLVDGK
jgi:peptide/nickel transport system substrate-binding protein